MIQNKKQQNLVYDEIYTKNIVSYKNMTPATIK